MTTAYEWDIEEMDVANDPEDILDHHHQDTLAGFGKWLEQVDGVRYVLVLVRSTGNNDDGLQDRSWAYPERDGNWWRLPETTDDGHKVPQRYHDELARAKP